ncbi:hypothetical protein [Natronorubrum daqingense]|nr:hypothetical protein [Natronorubrum daqingense]SIR58376.1 hypothetical protein SAMN05421809_1508 [Natronorubrum daqingense]
MERAIFQSDYREGNVSWVDWTLLVILLSLGVAGFVLLDNVALGSVALIAGASFAFFIAVVKSGTLTNA